MQVLQIPTCNAMSCSILHHSAPQITFPQPPPPADELISSPKNTCKKKSMLGVVFYCHESTCPNSDVWIPWHHLTKWHEYISFITSTLHYQFLILHLIRNLKSNRFSRFSQLKLWPSFGNQRQIHESSNDLLRSVNHNTKLCIHTPFFALAANPQSQSVASVCLSNYNISRSIRNIYLQPTHPFLFGLSS